MALTLLTTSALQKTKNTFERSLGPSSVYSFDLVAKIVVWCSMEIGASVLAFLLTIYSLSQPCVPI